MTVPVDNMLVNKLFDHVLSSGILYWIRPDGELDSGDDLTITFIISQIPVVPLVHVSKLTKLLLGWY